MPTTPSVRSSLPSALVLLSAACALLTAAVALAAPAAAIEDPRRPVGEVTHGPSCGPAVVRIAVTNGSQAHRVALVFDGTSEQDVAVLDAGEQGELVSQDVDRGRTVDVSVTVVASDGTAEEPLQFGTYTRPSAEDCAAVTPIQPEPSGEPARSEPPTTDTPVPTTTGPEGTTESAPSASTSAPSTSALPPSAADAPLPSGSAPAPDLPRPVPPDATSSSAGEPAGDKTDDPVGDPAADQADDQAGSASSASVSPGGVVTVRATGFSPGEPVTVSMVGVADPLTEVKAAPDGSVEAVVQIPRGAALGAATVQLVGGSSAATAGLDLQVAARARPAPEQTTSVPLPATGFTLIGAAVLLGLMAARRSRGPHPRCPAERE